MYVLGVILIIVCPFFFIDWHARMVIIARAYPRKYSHGKSWKRAHKHYKSNWTLVERLLCPPLTKYITANMMSNAEGIISTLILLVENLSMFLNEYVCTL